MIGCNIYEHFYQTPGTTNPTSPTGTSGATGPTGTSGATSSSTTNNEYADIVDIIKETYDTSNSNLNHNSSRQDIFNFLEEQYNNQTTRAVDNYERKSDLESKIKEQEKELQKKKVALNQIQNLDDTNKRYIEMNLNMARKKEYQIKQIQVLLIGVGILTIFPIIKKFNVMPAQLLVIIWLLCLILLSSFVIFMMFIKDANRDDDKFDEYNFKKPTDEQIARSKMLSEMSRKEKARCQKMQELDYDFDPSDINLDISKYTDLDKQSSSQKQCPN